MEADLVTEIYRRVFAASFADRISSQNDTFTLFKGTGIYRYTRVQSMPNPCQNLPSESEKNNPLYNFEVFAETIAAHYAYFERNQIDWDSLYSANRAKLNANSSEVEVFLAMEEIMNALRDNHGYIEPSDDVYEKAEVLREGEAEEDYNENLEEYGDFQIAQMVASTFLEDDMTDKSPLISWGKLEDNTGYIQVKAMWLYGNLNLSDSLVKKNGYISTYVDAFTKMNEGDYIEKERQGVAKVMEKVIEDLEDSDQIILDVRFNGGGQDAVGLEILGHFNEQRRKVASKTTKIPSGFTEEYSIYLDTSKNPYTKPVYLLTSQQSASATDFTTLASLQLPNFVRIGSHTQGALSDALEKTLPNGWQLSLSNEIYYDINGKCYESVGIAPDYELNYPKDRQTFFRSVANDLNQDKLKVLSVINSLREE